MRRRTFLAAASASLVRAGDRPRGGCASVLKFVPQADLAVLDPVWTTTYQTRDHGFMVFDTLFGWMSSSARSRRWSIRRCTEDGGKRWTLTLRPGLKFHDNTPVLARDCVASVKRWGARDSYGQALIAATDEIAAPDDRTITFRLKYPFPLLPNALGKTPPSMCPIMPERLAKTDPFKQVTEMIGSGPFRYIAKERVPGALVVYERFAGYVPRPSGTPSGTAGPKIVHFDRVEWHIIPDNSTVMAALQQGEVDWWLTPEADLLPVLKADHKLRVRTTVTTGLIATMRFNQLWPPFDNPAIRRAMLGAVEQSEYMIGMVGTDPSLWHDHVGIFCPNTPMASDAGMSVLTSPRDLRAREAGNRRGRLQGREGRAARADRHSLGQGARRHLGRPLQEARLQHRLSGDGLGDAGGAARQDEPDRQGRLEPVPHLLERHRHARPDRPRVPARQRQSRRDRLARRRRKSRCCAISGSRHPIWRRRRSSRPSCRCRRSMTCPTFRSASISPRPPTARI